MTSVKVPRRVKDRVQKISNQVYEQDHLAEHLGEPLATLDEGIQWAKQRGRIDRDEKDRLRLINREANSAKHRNFGQSDRHD